MTSGLVAGPPQYLPVGLSARRSSRRKAAFTNSLSLFSDELTFRGKR